MAKQSHNDFYHPGQKINTVKPIIKTQTAYSTRSEEHTSELQSRPHLVCRLLLEKKKTEHVEIEQTEILDVLLVELGHVHPLDSCLHDRCTTTPRRVRYHDPSRVHGDTARQGVQG